MKWPWMLAVSILALGADISLAVSPSRIVVGIETRIEFENSVSSRGAEPPSSFELSVATSGMRFRNYTDFQKSVDEREYLKDKIDDTAPSIQRKSKLTIDYLRTEAERQGVLSETRGSQ